MHIYDEFCKEIDSVRGFDWHDSWNRKVGNEHIVNYANLILGNFIPEVYEENKIFLDNFTGFLSGNNDFILGEEFVSDHPVDYLYLDSGRIKYTQGFISSMEGGAFKSSFYDGRYRIDKDYSLDENKLIKMIRRYFVKDLDYGLLVLQDNPVDLDFYLTSHFGGALSVRMDSESKIFGRFRSGADKNWKFSELFDLMKNCNATYFPSDGSDIERINFELGVSLISKIK